MEAIQAVVAVEDNDSASLALAMSLQEELDAEARQAFLANRKVLMGKHEMIRLLIRSLVQGHLGQLEPEHCVALDSWLDGVTLNTA